MDRNLRGATLAELESEIRRRQERLESLTRQRESLMARIETVDRRIAAITQVERGESDSTVANTFTNGAATNERLRKQERPKKPVPLADVIEEILAWDKPLKPGDIAQRVLARGHATRSKNFRSVVARTLMADDRFVAVKTGYYALSNE